ncbi:hypothetical protein C2E23DRAFT_861843 [Lenzites betulinus]|nr:hypothetical protein C2E23DRAFT_861843 [Lenzites betulinus]
MPTLPQRGLPNANPATDKSILFHPSSHSVKFKEDAYVGVDSEILASDEAALAKLGYKQEFRRAFKPMVVTVWRRLQHNRGSSRDIVGAGVFNPERGTRRHDVGAICAVFLMFIALALAGLGSAAPTSDSNSIGILSGVASIEWGCAVQLMVTVSVGSNEEFVLTTDQALLCLAIIIALPAATPKRFKNSASDIFGEFSNFYGWPNGWAFILSFLAPLWTIDNTLPRIVHIPVNPTLVLQVALTLRYTSAKKPPMPVSSSRGQSSVLPESQLFSDGSSMWSLHSAWNPTSAQR